MTTPVAQPPVRPVPAPRSFMDVPTQRIVPPARLLADARTRPAPSAATSLGSGVVETRAVGAARVRSRVGTIVDVVGRLGTVVSFAAVVVVSTAIGATTDNAAPAGDSANAGMTLGTP